MGHDKSTSIKYSEPNLEITIGEGDEKKVYHYHAIAMALVSGYIDANLSSGMQESQLKKLSFPEISPTIWDEMMLHLSPGANRPDVDRAMAFCHFYQKYDFSVGVTICDRVFSDYLKSDNVNLGKAAKVYAFVTDCGLPLSQTQGLVLFEGVLDDEEERLGLSCAMIACLAPMVGRENGLWDKVVKIISKDALPLGDRIDIVKDACFPSLVFSAIRRSNNAFLAQKFSSAMSTVVKHAGLSDCQIIRINGDGGHARLYSDHRRHDVKQYLEENITPFERRRKY